MVAWTPKLYIDWNNDGDFSDASEDVSSYLRAARVARGRSHVNDEFSTGSMTAELLNASGLFSVFDEGGSLYSSLYPGRQVKLEVVHDAVTYPVFRGYLSGIDAPREVGTVPSVVIKALDAFDVFRFGEVRSAFYENALVDVILDDLLDDLGWSASLRDHDTAIQTVSFYAQNRVPPITALRRLVKQELGGQFFMSSAGKTTFRNRYSRASAPVYATLSNIQAMATDVLREHFFDRVHHQYAGLQLATSLSAVYTMSGGGRAIYPGTSHPSNTVHISFTYPTKNPVTPVATTDYTANSAQAGGGTDKTASVSVSSFTAYGQSATIVFNGLDTSVSYLTALQVRGYPVTRLNDDRTIEIPVVTPVISGQTLSDSFEWTDDLDAVKSYAQRRAGVFSTRQPRPKVQLIGNSDASVVTMLGAELGKKVTVQDTVGSYASQVNDDFFIEGMQTEMVIGRLLRSTWNLFHKDMAGGTMFRISGAAGMGQDRSQISGTDRIAY